MSESFTKQFQVTGQCACMWTRDCPIHKLVGMTFKVEAPVRLMERRFFVPRVLFNHIESVAPKLRKLFVRYI
jgi:hypothetical protein